MKIAILKVIKTSGSLADSSCQDYNKPCLPRQARVRRPCLQSRFGEGLPVLASFDHLISCDLAPYLPGAVCAMDLPSPFKVPSVPGTPLYALSPERMNQQRRLPESPSLPNHLSSPERKHHRNSSDVRSKVEFLNSLSGLNAPLSPTRQNAASTNAALQRAMLGREEAEAQLFSVNAQLTDSQSRELRIAERVENLMEELQNAKERQVHERQVFEKEVRKARKEAFKAGSATVKAQEDLKEARQELKTVKAEAQHNQDEKEKARQEAFERAYALAGLAEEMEVLRGKLKSVEKERDTALVELQVDMAPKAATTARSNAQLQTEPTTADIRPRSAGNDTRPASRNGKT
jgi:hypothetical protein